MDVVLILSGKLFHHPLRGELFTHQIFTVHPAMQIDEFAIRAAKREQSGIAIDLDGQLSITDGAGEFTNHDDGVVKSERCSGWE